MKDKRHILSDEKPAVSHGLQTGILSAILVVIIVLMLLNTYGLNAVLEYSAEQYTKDVSYQLTMDISYRIEANQSTLMQLSDSLSRLEGDDLALEFLERKANILDFDVLVLVEKDGATLPRDFDLAGLGDLSGVQASFAGESKVVYTQYQSLLFSAPVYQGGQVDRVLIGVRNKENMQALIQPISFEGKGLSCIIDSGGQVVISPTDLKPFLGLDDIFRAGADEQTSHSILQMQQDMKGQASGVFLFTAKDDTRLVLSYHSLGVNDWILLTLVPADLISEHASSYTLRTFLIVGAVILVFILFLISLLLFYRRNKKRLEQIAFTDPLTGGMNNAAFQLACARLAGQAPPRTYTVVLLNIRGFKFINERYGVAAANDILKEIYQTLSRHIGEEELVTRAEADHFFLCLRAESGEEIQARLNEMVAEIHSLSKYADIRSYLKISQGACRIDDSSLDVMLIQDRAQVACQTPGSGAACVFYSSQLTDKMKQERELGALFEKSLQNHDFHVFLQPKVRLTDGRLGGAEALVRWIHPERGMIFPSDFIPLFEKNQNICRLDLYMFEQVCALIHRWQEDGGELLPISVNLSRMHFRNPDCLREFSRLKERYRVPDNLIEFELTESIYFDEDQREAVKAFVDEMHRRGFLCSLDDFGVGFSALALLKEFDVDVIKFDREFFKDIRSAKARSIIASFIELAARIGVKTVAEGIETQEQLDFLRSVHCDMVQGYVFSKPLSLVDFEEWRKRQSLL